ncbi:MAG: GGDEF domain-containing protein [Burkholderiales bacterium 68-12]|nr:MAG: GGDEF domain-containing protein [Burkholderiales bacterium 68-12]
MPHSAVDAPVSSPADQDEKLLRLIADAVPALIAYFELPGMLCRFANRAYAVQYGHTVQSVRGLTTAHIVGADAWELIRPYSERCARGEAVRYTREQTLPSGEMRMIEVNLLPHFDGTTVPVGAFVLITDITERWRAERAVRQSAESMRKFAAATEEAIVFHRDGIILDGNDALCRLTGRPLHEMLGQSIFQFISPQWHATTREYMRLGREDHYEIAVQHQDGRSIPVEVVGKTMREPVADYRVAVLRDITARKQAQEREAFARLHDPLTGLPHRRHLMEQLERRLLQAGQDQQHAAVLLANIDHFKTVNDSLGQHAGDEVLREVAARIRQCARQADVVARLGADEFALVLAPLATPEEATAVADQLLHAMQTPCVLGAHTVTLSLSIGISLFPEDGSSGDALLRHADAAMYHAKQTGPGRRQRFQSGMGTRALEVLERERQLREAIAAQAFVLHYQPQIGLQDGRLQGLEALVRWHHPVRGLVGPEEFIGFAEQRGLIAAIGRWVLHAACRQLKAWQDEGLALVPVAVNLSGLEFRQRDLVQEIAEVLTATGLAPQYLEIELTESVLMHHTGQTIDTLHALKALGVGIAVDDFGTGYSSLAYLKRYPIDKLKIDRSFVLDTPGHSDDVAIVTAIVQMGRSLQMRTVAEGVENAAQMALLRSLGCDMVQGYLLSPPMDAEDTRRWLGAAPPPG